MYNLKLILLYSFIILGCSFSRPSISYADASKKVIAYYFIQDVNKGYSPSDMPLDLITHAIYSFVDISHDGKCSMINDRRTYSDVNEIIIKQFSEIKLKHPHLKTMFSIGGATHSKNFSNVSLTSESRIKFVDSCLSLMKKYNFDGIDIDWEVVGFKTSSNPNSRPEDSKNFALLIEEFRKRLPKGGLLSAAISPEPEVTEHLDLKVMGQKLDWIGVMDYALCGFWSKRSCHQSDYAQLGKSAIQTYLNAGVRKEQIILGVPFFGHYWRVESVTNNGIGQKIIPPSVDHPYEDYVTYGDIEQLYLGKDGFQHKWDSQFNQPVLVNTETKVIISYDDEESIKIKATEVIKEGYGGMLAWEVSEDTADHKLLEVLSKSLKSGAGGSKVIH